MKAAPNSVTIQSGMSFAGAMRGAPVPTNTNQAPIAMKAMPVRDACAALGEVFSMASKINPAARPTFLIAGRRRRFRRVAVSYRPRSLGAQRHRRVDPRSPTRRQDARDRARNDHRAAGDG